MNVLEFVSKKEEEHGMKEKIVEESFGYIPFFNIMKKKLSLNNIETKTYGISSFDMHANHKDLETLWAEVYKENKIYFDK